MAIIERHNLGIAAEFAVASELCRRNIYAQLTLGTRKRTDLLVETKTGMLRIEVKAKQGPIWPNCKGIPSRQNRLLILVDFASKQENQRPDFYILTSEDWLNLVNEKCEERIAKGEVVLDDENVPVWVNQINKYGERYSGMGISARQVFAQKESWDKVRDMASVVQ